MTDYIFEIGLFCFGMTLVGLWLTVREFRALERRAAARQAQRRGEARR